MNTSEHTSNFVQEMQRRNYSTNTINNYKSCIQYFFSKSTKDHPKNINEEDIKNFLRDFCKVNTQRNYHSAIKKFYDICLNQKNKFKYIPYARKEQKLPIILSQDEVKRLFNACDNLKHKAILYLLYSTGMRVSEIINLKPEHIDSSRMIINIIGGKGNKDRQVMLDERVLLLLRDYYKKYNPKTYLFNGQFSDQYTASSIRQFIKMYAAKAEIKKRVWTHLIRHCTFTHMAEQGTDINLIQRLAGHNNVKTTSIYTHISHNLISKIPSPIQSILQ